jgi:hypothetical protein
MITTSIARTATALAAAAAALAVGCGGEDRLTQDQYAAELRPAVDRISAGFGTVFQQIGRASDDEAVPAAALARLAQVAATERRAADRLGELEPPENLEATADRFVAGARQQAEALAALSARTGVTVGELADAVEQGATAAPLRDLVNRRVVPAPGR